MTHGCHTINATRCGIVNGGYPLSQATNHQPLDLIWGISAIARVIGRTERQTIYMCQTGELPVKKVGSRYVVERSKLVEKFVGDAA